MNCLWSSGNDSWQAIDILLTRSIGKCEGLKSVPRMSGDMPAPCKLWESPRCKYVTFGRVLLPHSLLICSWVCINESWNSLQGTRKCKHWRRSISLDRVCTVYVAFVWVRPSLYKCPVLNASGGESCFWLVFAVLLAVLGNTLVDTVICIDTVSMGLDIVSFQEEPIFISSALRTLVGQHILMQVKFGLESPAGFSVAKLWLVALFLLVLLVELNVFCDGICVSSSGRGLITVHISALGEHLWNLGSFMSTDV